MTIKTSTVEHRNRARGQQTRRPYQVPKPDANGKGSNPKADSARPFAARKAKAPRRAGIGLIERRVACYLDIGREIADISSVGLTVLTGVETVKLYPPGRKKTGTSSFFCAPAQS